MPDEFESPVSAGMEARGTIVKSALVPRVFFMCQELLEQRRVTNSIAADSWDVLPPGRDSAQN